MKFEVILVLSLAAHYAYSQDSPVSRYGVLNDFYWDSRQGRLAFGINNWTKDTLKYSNKTKEFLVVSQDGEKIVEGYLLGGMGTKCGCSLEANGYWIERYRNGKVKEQGIYYCSEKIGTWIYYYEDGGLERIESLDRPYSHELSEYRLDQIFSVGNIQLENKAMRKGPYKEYYRNRQVKVEGEFGIVEEYFTKDTLYLLDPETYDRTPYIREGEFWKPKSIKIGTWNYFDKLGNLINSDLNYFPNDTERVRSIKRRYEELFL